MSTAWGRGTSGMVTIRIKSGAHAGRYVGPTICGSVTNPELKANPPVELPGGRYSLYKQQGAATMYFEHAAPFVQEELKKLGLETELVKV